jgi:hypothetical protein
MFLVIKSLPSTCFLSITYSHSITMVFIDSKSKKTGNGIILSLMYDKLYIITLFWQTRKIMISTALGPKHQYSLLTFYY